jgi:hypothetical protein
MVEAEVHSPAPRLLIRKEIKYGYMANVNEL